MRYYSSLGEAMPDDQLAFNAQLALQNKGGNLSERQMSLASDIYSSQTMLQQLSEWERQFTGKPAPAQGQSEKDQSIISTPPAKTDTTVKKP
jgi:hypothetical protein